MDSRDKELALAVEYGVRAHEKGKSLKAALKAYAEMREGSEETLKLENKHGIVMYYHCQQCLKERPEDQSPADWARLSVGFTKEGLQVWCWRHGLNVLHVHYEGCVHPARTDAGKPDAQNRTERRTP